MVKLKRTKEEIIKKAEELAVEYEAEYRGCGQCTFLAIIDSLRWGGLEIVPEDMEKRLFPGLAALSGGVCRTGHGTCGAVSSSALAIGIALGSSQEMQGKDASTMSVGFNAVQDAILDRYYKEYGSLLCKDVQRKYFGKAWDLTDDKMNREFREVSQGCTIRQTAMWAAETILDEFENGNVICRYNIL